MPDRPQKDRLTSTKDLRRLAAVAEAHLSLGDDEANAAAACDLALGGFLSLYLKGHVQEARGVLHLVLWAIARMEPDEAERAAVILEGFGDLIAMDFPPPVARREALRNLRAELLLRRRRIPFLLLRLQGMLDNIDRIEGASERLRNAGVLPAR